MICLDMVYVKMYNIEGSTQFAKKTPRGSGFKMIKFKGCPRCQGDLYVAEDPFGRYWSCMQCGYLRDLEQPALESAPVAANTQELEREVA